jgi:hypothetical protein
VTFDVKKHLIKVQGGREYLPVAARLIWFREEHPDWGISTECLHLDMEKLVAVFSAKVHNAAGVQVGQGTKSENVKGFGDFIEKAETGAIGRALAICGFGTQFAPELEEGERLADSPQPARPRAATEADVTADYGPPTEPAPVPGNAERRTISNPDAPLSEKQLAALQTMAHKLGYEDTDRQAIVFDMFKVTGGFKSLNKGQASEVFDMLKAQLEAAK